MQGCASGRRPTEAPRLTSTLVTASQGRLMTVVTLHLFPQAGLCRPADDKRKAAAHRPSNASRAASMSGVLVTALLTGIARAQY
jgi:hypothetical protein